MTHRFTVLANTVHLKILEVFQLINSKSKMSIFITPIAYRRYNSAMSKHSKNMDSFEEFLKKEKIEWEKYWNTLLLFPFILFRSTDRFKLFYPNRSKFIRKFFQQQPNILVEKMRQALKNYKCSMKKISVGVSLQKFSDEHKIAAKKAVEELEKHTCLDRDLDIWSNATRQLNASIAKAKKKYFRRNQLFIAKKKEKAGNNNGQGIIQLRIDACEVQVDTSNVGLLGCGGNGKVRVGFVGHFGTVAVKAINFSESRINKSDAERNLYKEIDLMHNLNHENIIRIFRYTSWKNSIALIMEYMPGGNLNTLLLCKLGGGEFLVPNIPEALRHRFCFDISSGVSYLHFAFYDERVAHGDLKPCNILMTDRLRCKVGDFGGADIATCTECLDSPPTAVQVGQWTRGYIAPERLNNPQDRVSKAMDVYSVGMIFYVILSRQPPSADVFRNKVDVANFCRQPEQEQLKQLTLKCTNHDNLKRPKMLEVREELQQQLCQEDTAKMVQHEADVLKTYRCKSFIDHTSRYATLADVENF